MRSDYAVITARSPRAVVLLPDLAGPDGARADSDFDRVLEWFGRVWGGAHMLCVPTRGEVVLPVFRHLAGAYDPDVVLPWQPTLGSLWQADPDAARALVARAGRGGSVPAADDDVAIAASTWGVGGRADPEVLSGDLLPSPGGRRGTCRSRRTISSRISQRRSRRSAVSRSSRQQTGPEGRWRLRPPPAQRGRPSAVRRSTWICWGWTAGAGGCSRPGWASWARRARPNKPACGCPARSSCVTRSTPPRTPTRGFRRPHRRLRRSGRTHLGRSRLSGRLSA